ncbi:MAG: hypothetical protein K6B17_10210 [Treponema sp.]|nr:hypothetical protein [Treponema sp.]
MNETLNICIGSVIALIASVVVALIQDHRNNKKSQIKDYIIQFASFYELEKLYVAEISRLRHDSTDEKSDKEKNIKEEFRRLNENNNAHIDLTAVKANSFLKRL